jgi:hypothetical protein
MDCIENDTCNNSSIVECLCCHGNLFTETLPNNRPIAQQLNHYLAVEFTWELCDAGLGTKDKISSWVPTGPETKSSDAGEGSNNLSHLSRPAVVSSQSRCADTWELEDLITETLPIIGHFQGASVHYSGFQASCNMSQLFLRCCNGRLFRLHYSDVQDLRG